MTLSECPECGCAILGFQFLEYIKESDAVKNTGKYKVSYLRRVGYLDRI